MHEKQSVVGHTLCAWGPHRFARGEKPDVAGIVVRILEEPCGRLAYWVQEAKCAVPTPVNAYGGWAKLTITPPVDALEPLNCGIATLPCKMET